MNVPPWLVRLGTRAAGLSGLLAVGLALSAPVQAQALVLVVTQNGDQEFLGHDLDNAGDVNGDGIDDMVVSAIENYRVFDGNTGELLHKASLPSQVHGPAVSGAGDVDGDGFADFVWSHPFDAWQGSTKGAMHVISGKTGQTLVSAGGLVSQDQFGWDVNEAGDINGDGIPDLVVGATEDEAGQNASGTVIIISGLDGSRIWTLPAFDVKSTGGSNSFGRNVDGVGDQDLDGVPDVIGAPQLSPGRCYVFSGRTGEVLRTLLPAEGELYAVADIKVLGDLDQDGIPEIGIGDEGAPSDAGVLGVGSVDVYRGGSDALLMRVFGEEYLELMAYRIAGGKDLNADGVPDIVVSSEFGDIPLHSQTQPGQAKVFSGADGSLLCKAVGQSKEEGFGSAVASLGDTNGDQIGEFAVGAMFDSSVAFWGGKVQVHSAQPPPLLSDKVFVAPAQGGTVQLRLKPGTSHAGELFVMLASSSGITPGLDAQGWHLPLNFDAYTDLALVPGATPLSSIAGLVSPSGTNLLQLVLPPGLPGGWVGVTLHHAYALFDPLTLAVTLTSNSVPLSLQN